MTATAEISLMRRALDAVEKSVGEVGATASGQAGQLRQAADFTQELAALLADAARAAATLATTLDRAATVAEGELGLARQTCDLVKSASRLAPPVETGAPPAGDPF